MQELIKARSHLLLDNPFFGIQAMALDLKEKASVGTAATNGKQLFYNKEFIFSLSHKERIFLLAHEVFHVTLGHHIRRNGRDIETWNKAADYAVNQILFQNKIGSVIDGALFDNRFDGQSTEAIYKTLYQERQANKKQDKGNGQDKEQKQDKNQADINGKCGGVLDSPESDTGKAQVEQKTMLAQAMQAARAAGKLPGNGEKISSYDELLTFLKGGIKMVDFSRGETMAQKAKEQLRNDLWCAANNYLDDRGSCGCMHPIDFEGDCRDDKNRFGGLEDLVDLWLAASELLEMCKITHDAILGVTGAGWDLYQIKPYLKMLNQAIDKAEGNQ